MEDFIKYYQNLSIAATLAQFALLLFTIVVMWRVFTKAGEGGWKIFIPIYNQYMVFKIAGAKKRFWLCLLLELTVVVAAALALKDILYDYSVGLGGFIMTNWIAGCILTAGICLALTMLITVSVNFSMAHAFGLPGIFGLGLLLLPTLFYTIIAFNGNIRHRSRVCRLRNIENRVTT